MLPSIMKVLIAKSLSKGIPLLSMRLAHLPYSPMCFLCNGPPPKTVALAKERTEKLLEKMQGSLSGPMCHCKY